MPPRRQVADHEVFHAEVEDVVAEVGRDVSRRTGARHDLLAARNHLVLNVAPDLGDMHLARQERGNARRILGHVEELEFVEFRRLAPMVFDTVIEDVLARPEFPKPERTGADRFGCIAVLAHFVPVVLGVDDEVLRQVERKLDFRHREAEDHLVVIDDLDLTRRRHEPAKNRRRRGA